MRSACLVALVSLCACNTGPSSVTDLKEPLLSLWIQPAAYCTQYLVVDGDNGIWTQTGCEPDIYLEQHGSITRNDRSTLGAAFENALREAHPRCGYTDTVYHAERSAPTFDGFDACEDPGTNVAPATATFIAAMKNLVP
jgi:hypothetical protein